jgi:hypothetical protein
MALHQQPHRPLIAASNACHQLYGQPGCRDRFCRSRVSFRRRSEARISMQGGRSSERPDLRCAGANPQGAVASGISAETACALFHKALPRERLANRTSRKRILICRDERSVLSG